MVEKILVIISGGEHNDRYIKNVIHNKVQFEKKYGSNIDYACISSKNDFNVYKKYINFKYTFLCTHFQFQKMCNFFNEYQHSINDYTWFIKIRPDMIINELTDMKLLIPGKINTRARVYLGPKKVLFGSSIGGDGCYSGIKDNFFSEKEDLIVIDDWFIAFDKSVVEKGVFKIYDKDEINDDLYQQYHVDLNNGKIIKGSSHNKYEHEWFHSNLMSKRGATFNVIGLDMTVKGRLNGSGMRSGHIL